MLPLDAVLTDASAGILFLALLGVVLFGSNVIRLAMKPSRNSGYRRVMHEMSKNPFTFNPKNIK